LTFASTKVKTPLSVLRQKNTDKGASGTLTTEQKSRLTEAIDSIPVDINKQARKLVLERVIYSIVNENSKPLSKKDMDSQHARDVKSITKLLQDDCKTFPEFILAVRHCRLSFPGWKLATNQMIPITAKDDSLTTKTFNLLSDFDLLNYRDMMESTVGFWCCEGAHARALNSINLLVSGVVRELMLEPSTA
jgi:uncharacterized protein YbaR (Trm112 family)